MYVLGITQEAKNTSAALLTDGKVIAAAAQERFDRVKRSRAFPIDSIRYCLDEAGISIADVDTVAVPWNPGVYLQKFNPLLSSRRRHRAEIVYSIPDNLSRLTPGQEASRFIQQIVRPEFDTTVAYLDHHRCHAANAYFLSPFDEAAVFTADGAGELLSGLTGIANGNHIEVLSVTRYPQSLGFFYSAVTTFLGFEDNADEWKVMALASYAPDGGSYLAKMQELVRLLPEGQYEMDLTYFEYFNRETPNWWTLKFEQVFGPPRQAHEPIEDRHYEIAGALQRVLEDACSHILRWLHKRTGCARLAMGGGVLMNSVFNGKVLQETPFTEAFISSCPDDSGNSIGAALLLLHEDRDCPRVLQEENFYGPAYRDEAIETALRQWKLPVVRLVDPAQEAARRLADGRMVAWFQGRMEFGPRALGNRSILADPRRPEMKDIINRAVKYREPFRPFAPAVLKEQVHNYFVAAAEAPFMERVFPIQASVQAQIPAVVHVDGSGRLQTVDERTNPLFHRLITEFAALTGIPVVLNTSFNLAGEPIVCTPQDAIRTFFTCGLDDLILGHFLLQKDGQDVKPPGN